ncbi:MAG: hypothetical protein JOY82_03990 [Streptosporangiaceae bacterium]|nr:hypothetical protein [Streptosporangiaceae bacterium]MBV9853673.1 hypothetical protein [Streptosporangiaceae bacterium]
MTVRQPPVSEDFTAEPRSVDLHDYWLIVRRRWALVLALTVLGAVGGLVYTRLAAPSYTATAQVVVMPLTQSPLNQPTQVSPQVNMSTEQAVAQSPLVITGAARLLHVPPAVLQAAVPKRLTVSVPANALTTSDVLQISWQAGSPPAAQAGANAFARAYLSSRHRELASQIAGVASALNAQIAVLQKQITRVTAELSSTPPGTPAQQNLTVRLNELTAQASTANSQLASLPTFNDSGGTLIAAALPLAPSGLSHTVIIALGVLLGLLLGLILAFLLAAFDDRVRDPGQLERKLGAATLAVLPGAEGTARENRGGIGRRRLPPLAAAVRPDSPAAESVRALRATLVAVAARRDLRTLLVSCADASISPSHVAAELGVALAESGRRVLLVAANIRGSSLAQLFDLPGDRGLSDVLTDGVDPEALTRHPRQAGGLPLPDAIAGRLLVLPGGPPTAHAVALLDSARLLDVLRSQRDAYEFVILDSPPATVAADVFSLAARVDAVMVLARGARTRGRAVEYLRRGLDQVGALIIGGVFIAQGNAGRRRRRSGGLRPAVDTPGAASERRPAGQQPDLAPSPSAVTSPLPAVSDDEALGPPGGLAKRGT